MPGNNHMWHLATVVDGLKTYVAMICLQGKKKGNVYIEELVTTTVDFTKDIYGNFRFIKDEIEALSVKSFLDSRKMLDAKDRFEQMIYSGMINPADQELQENIKDLAETLGLKTN
jgi:hypothetical protein